MLFGGICLSRVIIVRSLAELVLKMNKSLHISALVALSVEFVFYFEENLDAAGPGCKHH